MDIKSYFLHSPIHYLPFEVQTWEMEMSWPWWKLTNVRSFTGETKLVTGCGYVKMVTSQSHSYTGSLVTLGLKIKLETFWLSCLYAVGVNPPWKWIFRLSWWRPTRIFKQSTLSFLASPTLTDPNRHGYIFASYTQGEKVSTSSRLSVSH